MRRKGIPPERTAARAKGERTALQKGTVQALLTAAVISVPAAVGLGVLSPQILHMLFARQGDEAELCINSLRLLMPGMICLCVSYPIFSMLQGIGKAAAPLKIMLFGTAIKLIGNLVFIPIMGVDGAAVSTSLCYGAILALSLFTYVRAVKISISPTPFASVIYAGILCGAGAYLGADICGRYGCGNIASAAWAVISGGAVYIVSLYLLSIKKYGLLAKKRTAA